MELMLQEQTEQALYRELDKGIDDIERNRILSHEESVQILRERIASYDL